MRVFAMKSFRRFQRKEGLADGALLDTIQRAERGLIDAPLGGGLIKQRAARRGQGRSGGYRVIAAYRAGARAVFLYGFAKNEKDNIATDELAALRQIADDLLHAGDDELEQMVADDRLTELSSDEENQG
jgi:hypothetical protein